MEKKLYTNPTLEVITLSDVDVITGSPVSWTAIGDGNTIDFEDLF